MGNAILDGEWKASGWGSEGLNAVLAQGEG